jgi:hypothetical protein
MEDLLLESLESHGYAIHNVSQDMKMVSHSLSPSVCLCPLSLSLSLSLVLSDLSLLGPSCCHPML